MEAGDPTARWIMQAWLFFNEGFFWKPPQIQVATCLIAHPYPCSQSVDIHVVHDVLHTLLWTDTCPGSYFRDC
jgi:hypothetical protein